MDHAGLVATIAAALGGALVAGYLVRRLGLSPILGYLLAGVVIGPYTPGIVADAGLAFQLAEVGVVLLMFGVGLHFSIADLLTVRSIAVPGAVLQSAVATALGVWVAHLWDWSLGAGLVLGLSLSVASTVVLIRGLMDRGMLASVHGHVAVGWLVVEDLFTVLILVVLPAVAGLLGGTPAGDGGSAVGAIAWAMGKVVLLGALVFTVGSRVVPWILVRVARAESRELFTLAVLAVALGIAYLSAAVFDVSMALGAFLAGMVVAQSDLSHRAAAEALPLRDAFAVLFFVSVGMLFDPAFLLEEPWLVLATLGVVLVAKPVTALALVLGLRYPIRTGLTAAAGLAQIGEFSFILAGQGMALGLFPEQGHSVIIACAVISIAANPFVMRSADRVEGMLRGLPFLRRWLSARAHAGAAAAAADGHGPVRSGHAILCGHGRVGSVLATVLRERGWPFVVIEQQRRSVEALRRDGVDAMDGDAASPEILDLAGIRHARLLLVALTDPVATSLVVAHAASAQPGLKVLARVDSESERAELLAHGPAEAVVGTLEAAFQMARHLLQGFGVGALESEAAVLDLRSEYGYGPAPSSARFVQVDVEAGSAAAGALVSGLSLPPGTLLVVVRRRGEHVIPKGGTRLEAGDALLALADEDGRAHLDRMAKAAPAAAGAEPLGSAAP